MRPNIATNEPDEQVIEAADGVLNLAEVLTCASDMYCRCPCTDTVMPPPRTRWISRSGSPRNYPGIMSMAARGERPAVKW
jgi:hypothetical protein